MTVAIILPFPSQIKILAINLHSLSPSRLFSISENATQPWLPCPIPITFPRVTPHVDVPQVSLPLSLTYLDWPTNSFKVSFVTPLGSRSSLYAFIACLASSDTNSSVRTLNLLEDSIACLSAAHARLCRQCHLSRSGRPGHCHNSAHLHPH